MEAINSVIAQTYSNWEAIIVDDGSTDESNDIYKQFSSDDRIHIFYNGKNKGCAYTKHQCVLHASGELCGFLDPDDILLPNAIQITVEKFLGSPETVLTFSRHYLCDEKLEIKEESRLLELKEGESYFEHHDYRAEVFAGFRKEAYIQSGGLNTTYNRGVDADLYFRLEEQGKIGVINAFTYMYRRTSNSLVSNVEKMFYWNLIVRHDVCIRRGLPVDNYSLKDFHNYIEQSITLRTSQNEQALSSKAYKIGKMILRPFSILKHR